jgi:Methyltransferase domain
MTSPDAADPELRSLDEIGIACGTDKSSTKHHYLELYDDALRHLRFAPVRLMEIGVFNGSSLRMWRDYFPNGTIVGVDNKRHSLKHSGGRISVHLGDQADPDGLIDLAKEHGPFDIIVDDGSHIWNHQIKTMTALLPLVKPRGIYILEDLHTSFGPYIKDYSVGGGETGASFVLRFAERVLGDRFHKLDDEPEELMANAARLVRSVQICNRTAIFRRR